MATPAEQRCQVRSCPVRVCSLLYFKMLHHEAYLVAVLQHCL